MSTENNPSFEQALSIIKEANGNVESSSDFRIICLIDSIRLVFSWETWKKKPTINVTVIPPSIGHCDIAHDIAYTASYNVPMPDSIKIGYGVNPGHSARRITNTLIPAAHESYKKYNEYVDNQNKLLDDNNKLVESLKEKFPNTVFVESYNNKKAVEINGLIPGAKIRVENSTIHFNFRGIISSEKLEELAKILK